MRLKAFFLIQLQSFFVFGVSGNLHRVETFRFGIGKRLFNQSASHALMLILFVYDQIAQVQKLVAVESVLFFLRKPSIADYFSFLNRFEKNVLFKTPFHERLDSGKNFFLEREAGNGNGKEGKLHAQTRQFAGIFSGCLKDFHFPKINRTWDFAAFAGSPCAKTAFFPSRTSCSARPAGLPSSKARCLS